MSKTIRLIYPDWMGGANPNYAYGCKYLSMLMPQNDNTEILEVPVDKNLEQELIQEDGVTAKSVLLRQQKTASQMIETKDPDKIIVIGGPCSAEQAPFDFLHGKYPDAGVIWIDVHPDITRTGDYPNEHAMVLGNLLGDGCKDFADLVKNPFKPEDVMYVGVKTDEMEVYEKEYMSDYKIHCATPEQLKKEGAKPVVDWINEKGFKQIIVHFDLDVLSPEAFRSLLCNEPLTGPSPFVIGSMNLNEITDILVAVENATELVGLGICEYIPWDAINLRKTMEKIKLFSE